MTQDDLEHTREELDAGRGRAGDPEGRSGRGPQAERLPTERREQPTAAEPGTGEKGLDTRGGNDPGTVAEEAARVVGGTAGNENKDQPAKWDDTGSG